MESQSTLAFSLQAAAARGAPAPARRLPGGCLRAATALAAGRPARGAGQRPRRGGGLAAHGAAAAAAASATAAASAGSRRRGARRQRGALVARRAAGGGASVGAGWRGDSPPISSLPYNSDGSVDYSTIDASPISVVLMGTVRNLLAKEAGHDSTTPGFPGMMELVREVNDSEGTVLELQTRARGVFEGILPAIFIGWVPPLWKKFVQPNVPQWSQNGAFFLVFYLLFPWLMGPMVGEDFIDVPVPQEWRNVLFFLPATVRVPQSVKAERCRFLESAQCASVCVNTCKVPSQEWLRDDFGMNLHIQPNYDDFSCRWRFGKEAPPLLEDEAVMSPCFTKCPTKVKGAKDALTLRERLQRESDERLLKAVMELTPDGTALSMESLQARKSTVKKVGKCWSVDNNRQALREAAVARESA